MIGPAGDPLDQRWNQLALVFYPSRRHMRDMLADADYRAAVPHRVAGLERAALLVTEPWPRSIRSRGALAAWVRAATRGDVSSGCATSRWRRIDGARRGSRAAATTSRFGETKSQSGCGTRRHLREGVAHQHVPARPE